MAQDQNNQSNNLSHKSTKLSFPKITKLNPLNKDRDVPNLEGKTLLNRYKVEIKLEKVSGEANLYKAYDLNSNQKLVVKQYRRKDGIKQDVLAKIQGLNSDNVVKILEYGDEQGFPFVVEPYYDGHTIREYINEGVHFSLDDLKSIIACLNEILRTIHAQDIIHKDLKPDNIMAVEKDSNTEFVLIDFGISTETNGQTIVVTQTGSTPYYAAPETNNGAFSIYSDYYSLGITIYELYTGYTPFQSNALSHSDVALYAQMQKIPYPDDFPQELKDLIDGLTYKDLSNRNDLSNPNRRWTYNEVANWLNGEKQIVPGTGTTDFAPKGDFQIPYFFKGKQLYNLSDIANEYYTNPDEAIKEIGRGFLSRYFEQINDEERRKYTEQAEKEITSNSPVDTYGILVKLLYQITPNLKQILWKNKRFENLTEYGDALIDEVVKNKDNSKEFIATAKTWLELDVLITYTNYQIDDLSTKQSLLDVLNKHKQLLKTVPLDENHQALRLGYSLTNREDFKIGSQCFNTVDDFNAYFDKLYNDDIVKYVNFFQTYQKELLTHEKLLVGKLKDKFKKHIVQNDSAIVLLDGEFVFKNSLDVLNYLECLYNQNQLMLFYSIIKRAYNELITSNKFVTADKEKYNKIINAYKEIILIDEHVFKNQNQLNGYVNSLLKFKLNLVRNFIDSHQNVLNNYEESSNSFHNNILTELEKIAANELNAEIQQENSSYTKISKNINIGDIVKFGRYFQNDNKKKEPIEWIVLDKKDNQALLISKFALDCKPYHSNYESITWANCFLRNWCNSYFLEQAFKESERKLIQESNNQNNAGSNTKDKIFLLSIDEARKYFDNNYRICIATPYAISNGAWNDDGRRCYWWLRSRGHNGDYAACIYGGGGVDDDGSRVDYGDSAVRPAFLLKLS